MEDKSKSYKKPKFRAATPEPNKFKDDVETVMKSLHVSTDAFLFGALRVVAGSTMKPEDIKSRDDLKHFVFVCPTCDKIKPATELVLIQKPLHFDQTRKGDMTHVMVSQEMMVQCEDCLQKTVTVIRGPERGG